MPGFLLGVWCRVLGGWVGVFVGSFLGSQLSLVGCTLVFFVMLVLVSFS